MRREVQIRWSGYVTRTLRDCITVATENHEVCLSALHVSVPAKWCADDYSITAWFDKVLTIEVQPPSVFCDEYRVFFGTKGTGVPSTEPPRTCQMLGEVSELVSAAFADGYAVLIQAHGVSLPRIPSWARGHVAATVEKLVGGATTSRLNQEDKVRIIRRSNRVLRAISCR